jgi:hypothetical protein
VVVWDRLGVVCGGLAGLFAGIGRDGPPRSSHRRRIGEVRKVEWEVREESVYRLFRDGTLIVDERGAPRAFESEEAAWLVAANWELVQAPTYAELKAMSSEEIYDRIKILQRLGVS